MATPTWRSSQKTHILIFSINRGLSVFIRTPMNQGLLYDLGASEDSSPTDFLEKKVLPHITEYKKSKLSQIVISHPHSDHISEINSIAAAKKGSCFYPSLHTCPHDKDGNEKLNFGRITNPKSSEGLVADYRSIYSDRNLPLQTITYDADRSVPNVSYGLYYVRPPEVERLFPKNDQEYSNGVSIVLYYRHGRHTVLIPGDINPDVMKHLLDEKPGSEKRFSELDRNLVAKNPDWPLKNGAQPSLKELMNGGLSILVAPHYGLESGFSQELYDSIGGGKPQLVAISEKRHGNDNDGTVDTRYSTEKGASGLDVWVDGAKEFRRKVSTQNGHHILIEFQGTGGLPAVYLEKNPEKLLDRMS